MFTDGAILSSLLRNPLEIQNLALKEIEDRNNGTYAIADSNSSFCNLMEFGSSISAACMQEIDNVVIPGIYAKRAQTFRSISRHMSDYDYVNLFGTPAHTTLILSMDTVTLLDQAKDYNTYYKKAVIPVDTVFNVGGYQFGIYYPIEIQINRFNNNILVLQNVADEHPLHKLVTNVLVHKTQVMQGVPMLAFSFPVYQFARSYLVEDAISATGFTKSYTYNNQFYACRIFTYFPSNKTWIELGQTTSDLLYDPNVATAKIFIEPDIHQFAVNIPQIYFDSGKIGSKIVIELYTTHGALDLDISTLPANAFTASFFNNNPIYGSSDFSLIFKKYPSLQLLPHATKIVGGSDSQSFDEVKTRVINNISHRNLLITPTDITKYFEDDNFKVTKHLDNISNRIYFCNGTLTDSEGSYIPVTNSFTLINAETVDSTSDIRTNQSYSVTILPTAMYRYQPSTNTCEILSDVEKTYLENLDKEDFVAAMNTGSYLKSPFHVVVDLPPSRYQTARSYNLFSTSVESIQFKYDNDEIMAQMVGYEATISHDKDGSDGYTIRFIIAKSDDLKEVSEDDLLVYVLIKDSLKSWCGLPATMIGKQDEYFIYEIHLETDYLLEDNNINFTNIDLNGYTAGHVCALESEYHVVYMVKNAQVPGVSNNYQVMEGIPIDIQNSYIGMGRQIYTLHLGHHLDNIIYNICDMTWDKIDYEKYEVDIPKTYPTDVYETNSDGTLKVEIRTNEETGEPYVWTNKLYTAGDVVRDEYGNTILEHGKGEYKRDPSGNLIQKSSRTYQCLVYMMQIDARMYMSQDPVHESFTTRLPAILESYFTSIEGAKEKILEETKLYYRPIRTIGQATFGLGDGRTSIQNLDMSFRMKLHVPQFVKNSEEYQKTCITNIVSITEDALTTDKINMTDIATLIKEKLSSYIDNIDVLGINGDKELQTIQVLNDDAQASVARVLKILKDGSLSLEKDITLEFVATDKVLLS